MRFQVVLSLAFVSWLMGCAAGAKDALPEMETICELQDARINESSGLAASRKYSRQKLLITHNDSGGEAKLFYVNLQGFTVAEVSLKNATNIDWEDIAIAGDFIYVGDIGDNLRKRESITIYRLSEPEFNPNKTGQNLEVVCEKMTLKYPDAPCDAETLLASANAEIILVSKNGGASRFYNTPQLFENNSTQTLELAGKYAFKGESARSYLTTGGDLDPAQHRFVVRTYTHAYEWTFMPHRAWQTVFETTPRIWQLPTTKQGEAICYAADGQAYFVSSEGAPAPIWKIEFTPNK